MRHGVGKNVFLSEKITRLFIIAFVAINAILKYQQYSLRSFFWNDELSLVFNLLEHSYFQLFFQLDLRQVAPPLFLVITKVIVNTFGETEKAFRFLPFMASVLSPYALYHLMKARFKSHECLLSVLLLCLTPFSFRYASEFKPYSLDVLVVILIMISFFKLKTRENTQAKFLWGIVFFASPLISIPSVFILTPIAFYEAYDRKKKGKDIAFVIASFVLMLLVYLLQYFFNIGHLPEVKDFWIREVATFTDPFHEFAIKAKGSIIPAFKNQMGFRKIWWLALLLFLLGIKRLYQRKREYAFKFYLPILLCFIASCFLLYPFKQRMILFLYPFIFIGVAMGVSFFLEKDSKYLKIVGIFLVVALLWNPLQLTYKTWKKPYQKNEVEALLRFIDTNLALGDAVYVQARSLRPWRFYWQKLSDKRPYVIQGSYYKVGSDELPLDVEKIIRKERVWMVFSHCGSKEQKKKKMRFIESLNRYGQCEERFKRFGEFAYHCQFPSETAYSKNDQS